ncbi:MAG: FAD-dependent oxidoreductase [Pseudomonadota bacterium]
MVERCDCVVIGAGIAGMSLAARLAEETAGRMKVVVLEAESAPGYHASGRSVAIAHYGLGDTLVRALTQASLAEFRGMVGPSGAPITHTIPALHIARADQGEAFADLVAVHKRFEADFELLQGEDIRKVAPALKVGPEAAHQAILDRGALKLDTDAMLARHLTQLRANGGELVSGARVTAIRTVGELYEVETTAGTYQSPRLVNAAGAWADEVARMAGVPPIGLEPRRRTVISFDAPDGEDVAHWPFIKTVGEGFYTLPEGRSRLLASSMDQTPSTPCDAAPEELDIAIAADRILNATTLEIRRVAHSWAGLRSFAPDERPVIGEAAGAPDFFWFAGQGGYGFQTAPALARIGASVVLGEEWPSDMAAAGVTPADLSPGRFGA